MIDIVRSDGELVEIQAGGFSSLGPKLDALLDQHRMRIVHPLAAEQRIVRVDGDGVVRAVRRSPRRERPLAIFDRLVSFPSLLAHPNLTVELVLCREDHVRGPLPRRGRRGGREPGQRKLVELLGRLELSSPEDALDLDRSPRARSPTTIWPAGPVARHGSRSA